MATGFNIFSARPTDFCQEPLVPLNDKTPWSVSSSSVKDEDDQLWGPGLLVDGITSGAGGFYSSAEGDEELWIEARFLWGFTCILAAVIARNGDFHLIFC